MDPSRYLIKAFILCFYVIILITLLPKMMGMLTANMRPGNSGDKTEGIQPRDSLGEAMKTPFESMTEAISGLTMYIGIIFGAIVMVVLVVLGIGALLDHRDNKRAAAAKERLDRKVNEALAGNPSYVELRDLESALQQMEQTDNVKQRLEKVRQLMAQLREEEEASQLADIDRRLEDVSFREEPAPEPEAQQTLPPGQHDSLRSHLGSAAKSGRAMVRRRVRRN